MRAFTLIELLVVIGIILVLAGMAVSASGVVREAARTAVCRGRLASVVAAALVYRDEAEGRWPAWSEAPGTMNTPAIAVRTQEWLASQHELPRLVFQCPAQARIRPLVDAIPGLAYGSSAGFAWMIGMATTASTAWAYDINLPVLARAQRVVIGDRPRDPTTTAHRGYANVAFVGGHAASLARSTRVAAGNTTWFNDGTSIGVVTACFATADEADDNIYDDAAETTQTSVLAVPYAHATGSTSHAFLR